MKQSLITKLYQLNNQFYQQQGASFAQTRGAPWQGWQALVEHLRTVGAVPPEDPSTDQAPQTLTVFDLACGNMRFESFLHEALAHVDLDYYGADNSIEMAGTGSQKKHFQSLDALGVLIDKDPAAVVKAINAPASDLVVSFGFMHHVPSQKLREQMLQVMIDSCKPRGYIAVSFWQFLNSKALAEKAAVTHAAALKDLSHEWAYSPAEISDGLDYGDYFLGWQGIAGAYRYCHNFSSAEIAELVGSVSGQAKLIAQFDADGRTGNLNAYIVLQKVCSADKRTL